MDVTRINKPFVSSKGERENECGRSDVKTFGSKLNEMNMVYVFLFFLFFLFFFDNPSFGRYFCVCGRCM